MAHVTNLVQVNRRTVSLCTFPLVFPGCQVTKTSTATLVVEVAKGAVGKWGTAGGKLRRKPQGGREVSDSVASFLVHLV